MDARKYSSPHDSGYHFAVEVRQRGKENPETITLVLSRTSWPSWPNGSRSSHGS
jgi:hypothetical protein